MALFDFLKRKEEMERSKPQKKEEKPSAVKKTVKEPKKTSPKKEVVIKEGKFSHEVIKEPHISEKSTNLAQKNEYVFKVYPSANKPEIKKSVEGIYGVNVLSVNLIKIPPKKRRLGRIEGLRKGFIKAVVKIKDGQKIEIF